MRKLLIFIILFSTYTLADDQLLKIEVDDCGPLARGKLGVVFSSKPHGSGKSYFTEGSAYELCPKLTSSKYVIGYEEDICTNYKPRNKQECGVVKVFVIQNHLNE